MVDTDYQQGGSRLATRPDDRVFRITFDQNQIPMAEGDIYEVPQYVTTNNSNAPSTGPINVQVLYNGITTNTILVRVISTEKFAKAFDGTFDQYIGLDFAKEGAGTANITDVEYIGFRATYELSATQAEELTDVGSLLEENKLELFDYFPKVRFDSKVDIEVETTTKFEDASVSGFVVENSGNNYQVNDRLIFDDTDTEGYGISAVVRTIEGKNVNSYNYELIDDVPHGVVECSEPHDLLNGDRVLVNYTPDIASEIETYKVKIVDGIEQINVTQIGTGYNDDVPISVEIDGVGQHASINPIIDTGNGTCLLYTSPSPRDRTRSRMPSSA